jgi:RNA polymerase sigma-70 factor (ECF subfamily)
VRAKPAIGNVVKCVLGADDPEHDDVLQSCVERLLAVVRVTPRRGGSVVQLAAVIARNVAVDARRARSRRARVFVHDDDALTTRETPDDPESIASARESLGRFGAALGALRAENASVVYAHDVLGHELAEIAVMLGISVAAAQSRLVRGRGRIALLLGGPR